MKWFIKAKKSTTEKDLYKNLSRKEELKILRENDWYYQHSWFSSYFWDKLKRNVMNIIYKLYSSIEDMMLEKYLVEFYFFTKSSDKNKLDAYNKKHGTMYQGDFKCYLPILFMVKNYNELEGLVTIINGQLYSEYECSIIQTNISDKIGSEEMIAHQIKTSTNKLVGHKSGVLNIMTFTPQSTDKELEIRYKTKKDRYTFQIIKTGCVQLLKGNFNYFVHFYKMTPEE